MSAPTEAEATVAVDAAARKAWDLNREVLRDQGYATPEFDALDPAEQLRVREQVLPLVWAALSAIERPSEVQDRLSRELDLRFTTYGPIVGDAWLDGYREAMRVVRGEVTG